MRVVIVTDIFGRTAAVELFVDLLARQSIRVSVIDPYVDKISSANQIANFGNYQEFANEQEAYACFIKLCGHDRFADLVQDTIEVLNEPLIVIGFSVGAAAAWRGLEGKNMNKIQHFIGFYPGQIRNYLGVDPICPTTLIFPREENHFSVVRVMDVLVEKKQVHCHQVDALHGFMNPCSTNYSKDVAKELYKRLADVVLSSNPDRFRNSLTRYLSQANF